MLNRAGKSDTYRKKLLDKEIGTIRRRWHGHLKIALAYPNTYHVGMSNLGFQIIYKLLNSLEGVICERVFVKKNFRIVFQPFTIIVHATEFIWKKT